MDEYSIREKTSVDRGEKKYYHQYNSHNGTSSPQIDKIRGIIDIAESSDDRFSYRSVDWSPVQSDDETEEAPDFSIYQNLLKQNNSLVADLEKNVYDSFISNKTEENLYFILDITLLAAGLQTIPFYKRMDYPAGIFDKTYIKRMNQAAELADKNYTEILKNFEGHNENKPMSADSNKNNEKQSNESPEIIEDAPVVEKENENQSEVISNDVAPAET